MHLTETGSGSAHCDTAYRRFFCSLRLDFGQVWLAETGDPAFTVVKVSPLILCVFDWLGLAYVWQDVCVFNKAVEKPAVLRIACAKSVAF